MSKLHLPLILYASLFLRNVCQYDTRSLLARPKTDVVAGVTTRGQAAPTDAAKTFNLITSVVLFLGRCFPVCMCLHLGLFKGFNTVLMSRKLLKYN